MTEIVNFPQTVSRRYEVLTIDDDSLCKIGVMRGDDFVVSLDEFFAGDFHAIDVAGKARVMRFRTRPPNLIGRVITPPFKPNPTLAMLPPEGMPFSTDEHGNVVEVDNAVIERCWGIPASSCYGFGFISNVAPEYRAAFVTRWSQAVLKGGICQLHTEAERIDGARIPLVVTAIPITKGASQRFRGWSGVTQLGELVKVA